MKLSLSKFKNRYFALGALFGLSLIPGLLIAGTIGNGGGTGGAEFQVFFDFIYGAATGYLGRSIAIVGGLVGLGIGAFSGKMLIAGLGVGLTFFGVLGPTIVNAMFTSALI